MGFVSNSSSSSFCIVGLYGKALGDLGLEDINDFDGDDNFEVYTECSEVDQCIGWSIKKLNGNETLDSFKEKLAKKMTEVFKKEVKPSQLQIIHDEYAC
jgi:hypothetical protein